MSIQYLIGGIVRQTTVRLAQLATAGGIRAPLAHIAEQVFVELAGDLVSQGVSRKVSADMFGMALRTYQRRTQRLRESATERGRSLWEALRALVRTIGARLQLEAGSPEAERVGGSTYTLEVWHGHPLETEVLTSLQRFRTAQSELRNRVDTYNQSVAKPSERLRVISYAGQSMVTEHEGEE